MTSTADVVIVGAGVTGLATALELARLRAGRIVVVERRFPGAGGTGRSVGIIRQLYPSLAATAMVVRSLAVYREFGERVGGDSGYVACGVLIGVGPALREALEATLATQRPLGVRAELVEPGDVARLEPRIDASGLGAALWEPDSGYADPASVTVGLAGAARRLGVTIHSGCEVTAVDVASGRAAGVVTAHGEHIAAPVVVNAAGLWAPALARLAGVELPIVIGRHPVFVVERGLDFGPPHSVYLDLAGGSYLRPETGGLTLTGSLTDDETAHPMDPEGLGADVGLDEAAAVLARAARAVPALETARWRRGWVGAFDITPDWMPILDESPLPGFWIAAGMSGHGFKLAPAVGETMAALITGARPPVDPAAFRLDRFRSARPAGTFVASYLSPEAR